MSKRVVLWFVLISSCLVSAQTQVNPVDYDAGCKAMTGHQLSHDFRWMGSGVILAPRRAIKLSNIKWELPVVAATVLMVNYGDSPASRQVQNTRLVNAANTFSNVGLYSAWALAGGIYAHGCATGNAHHRSVGLQALEAGLSAWTIDGVFKYASNRVRPDRFNSQGNFWDAGGRSFASGHAAMSFGIASVLAHNTHSRWKKIALYGLAGAVSFARFPAKKHFLSDILVGSTIGYVTGTYMTDSPPMQLKTASGP